MKLPIPPEPLKRKTDTLRVVRTHPLYRPFATVVLLASKATTPPRAFGVGWIIIGFAALILVGTMLLSLTVARQPGTDWTLLTAFFTAMSAVCVTGLVIVDTGTYWSNFGQAVILGLIQVGGLGIMTVSMLILIILGRPISFRDRFELQEVGRIAGIRSVSGLVLVTILITVLMEFLGWLALWYRLHFAHPGQNEIWRGAFHAVSAFNNAGFDIMGNNSSLTPFIHDPVFLMVISLLVVSGGLNILVLLEFVSKRSFKRLSVTSKLILVTSGCLLALGFLGVLTAEFTNPKTLGSLNLADKVSNAFFHSVTPRTAGFSTLPINDMNDETQFLTMAFMFVGGATGSTAGGIKVTTFAVLLLATAAATRGYSHVPAFGRRLSERLVYRALAIASLYLTAVFVGTTVLIVTEPFVFRQVLFEVFSALGTVGLSTGITSSLSIPGKLTVVALMFIGRLGPMAIGYALARRAWEPDFKLPEQEVAVG